MSSTKETQVMMEKRHQEENAELEETAKTLLKAAKKGKKAEIESKIIQMQFDLKAKHYAEEEELENEADNMTLILVDEKPISLEVVSIRGSNDEVAGESKKAKAKRKQEKKTQKEAERLSVKEKIKESNSGPSAREIELERINNTLKTVGCEIKPIVSDGNCLYRAIADQFISSGRAIILPSEYIASSASSGPVTFKQLRVVAANYIRQHSSDFTPYLEMTAEDPAFEEYCRKVESDVDAEWGGQLEVTALAAALHTQIAIYSADSPVLVMGEGENSSADASSHPIRISYHRHYFALGEHYNSIVPTKSVTVN